MKVLAISSAVRGFHVYKDIWKPTIGDKLACEREFDNCFDKFAIKVVNNGETMGHLCMAQFYLLPSPPGQPLGQVQPFGPGGGELFETVLSRG